MSFWSRVKDALRAPPPPTRAAAPAPSMPAEEAYLRQLLDQLTNHPTSAPAAMAATGAASAATAAIATPPATAASSATSSTSATASTSALMVAATGGEPPSSPIGRREFWAAVDGLIAGNRARTATELLRRFAQARPDDLELAARLVELLCEALDHAGAVPYLERLAASTEAGAEARTLRARFLLAEAAERAGDIEAARASYEAVLALDLDYPKARARAERLRPAGSRDLARAVGDASPTILGVEAQTTDVGARYRLVRELGRGAAGAVYLARDQELERDIAVKLLHPHSSGKSRAAARARSFNEARIAAALRHPGVVAIYDLDEDRSLIAMELCQGGTLRHLLGRGRLTPREALRRGAELLRTLEAVHRAGVVHQDLKPGNLLFRGAPSPNAARESRRDANPSATAATTIGEGDGALVLADFGLAHLDTHPGDAADPAAPGDELRGAAGTLGYMAPEQRRGEASTAADVYAAGVILHEMLVGAAPDRTALLRGENRFAGQLPDAVAIPLGAAALPLCALLSSLMTADPADRPTAAAARVTLDELRAA